MSKEVTFRLQPDATKRLDESGLDEFTLDVTKEEFQGIWAVATVAFIEPSMHIQMSALPYPLLVRWQGANSSDFQEKLEDWTSGFFNPTPYNVFLIGPMYSRVIGFETADFMDGVATAAVWFGLELQNVIGWLIDEHGDEVPYNFRLTRDVPEEVARVDVVEESVL